MELYLISKDSCASSEKAKAVAAKLAQERNHQLTVLDAKSYEAGRLILGLGILEVPALVLVKNKRKVAVIEGAEVQSAQKVMKTLVKHES